MHRKSRAFLKKDEYLPYAPNEINATVNIHHCKEGKNNDRLYITRKEDGSVVAYCHHCGLSGVSKHRGPRNIYSYRNKENTPSSTHGLTLPADSELDINKWPAYAKAWPLKYGITPNELHDNHIVFSNSWGRVLLPIFAKEGTLVSYQARRVATESSCSATERDQDTRKYITRYNKSVQCQTSIFIPRNIRASIGSNTVVLVEDALSAIKTSRLLPSAALLGTTVQDMDVYNLVKDYDNIIIFLDNDNGQVKSKMNKLKKRIELLARGRVVVIRTDKDPKEHSMSELETLFRSML